MHYAVSTKTTPISHPPCSCCRYYYNYGSTQRTQECQTCHCRCQDECRHIPCKQNSYTSVMNTFIRTKQHRKKEKNSTKTAIYSLTYIYIKQVVHQINSWTLRHNFKWSHYKHFNANCSGWSHVYTVYATAHHRIYGTNINSRKQ